MLIFYKKETPLIQLQEQTDVCDASCITNCLKPKSKCCNKFKKKGINCKRCPHILLQKAS
jgi:glyceraldehyde-3-phosphate dehydrogenase/erythrose-4-phosphate dehydrogenase